MKRSRLNPGKGFGPRTTPLRRAALNRQSQRSREAAKSPRKPLTARPAVVTAEERRARKLVRARSEGRCEVCGRAEATNFQHRKGKAHLGEWSAVNGLDVCGMGNVSGCHGRIHQSPALAYERGWSVRSTSDPAATPVWLAGRGWFYLLPDGTTRPADERKTA